MADPLGVAASVASFVSLACQAAQGIKFLHSFLGDTKDTPIDIQTLAIELQMIGGLLKEIQRQNTENDPTMRKAINSCKRWVDELDSLVRRYDPSGGKTHFDRRWLQINTALRKKKFGKYIHGLERAKMMLLHAQFCTAK